MNPYMLIVTGPLGSVIIPLGTEQARNWRGRYETQLANPVLAELRPIETGSWPTLQVSFPPGASLAFLIKTQGILSTRTQMRREFKTYCLGWSLNGTTSWMSVSEGGYISLKQEENESWQQS